MDPTLDTLPHDAEPAGSEPTVDQLLAAADELAAVDGELTARLDSIRHTAVADGVRVTVDLHGRLVGLEFEQPAMRLGGGELAKRIRRLAEQAAVEALTDGVAALAGVCDDALIADITDLVGLTGDSRPAEAPERHRRAG